VAYVAQQYIWHIVASWWQYFQYLLYCWQCHVSKIRRECIVMFLWLCTYTTNFVPFTFWHRCLQTFIIVELENNIIASAIMWKYKVPSYLYYCYIKLCVLFSVDTCSCKLQASLNSPAPKIVGSSGYKLWWLYWHSEVLFFFFPDNDGLPVHVGLFIELTRPTQPTVNTAHSANC